MTSLTIAPRVPRATPRLVAARERLLRAGPELWRVVDRRGRVVGHLRAIEGEGGVRYRAERLHRGTGAFLDAGTFWSADDAVACLRDSR